MVTTSDGIWSPDASNPYYLTQDLAAMAESIQQVLNGRSRAMLRGTPTERAATPSEYWQTWVDSDSNALIWIGDKSGGWRRFNGGRAIAAGPWSYTAADGTIAGRTLNFNLNTRLEANESLLLTARDVGTGFGFISLSSVQTVDPNSLLVAARQVQVGSIATNPISFNWQITRTNA